MVAVVILLVRRSLTPQRALAFGGMLILSALFSYRDFISDPLGAVLGFSWGGIGAVRFDLGPFHRFWLGKCGEPPVFAAYSRVLLVLTNYVLSMTVWRTRP